MFPRLVSAFAHSDFLDKLRQDVPIQFFYPNVFFKQSYKLQFVGFVGFQLS